MRTLLADISNGRTKLALAACGALIGELRLLPTSGVTERALQTVCADWVYEAVALCSVVPPAAAVAEAYFSRCVPVLHVGARAELPVDFTSYAGRATLGADRVANAVAAAHLYPDSPLAVIDAGTATTVDVVLPPERAGEKPRFLGGAIAPGVGTMVRALHGGTAQLPEVPLMLPAHAVGENTVEALQNGCVRGYRGLLHELLQGMQQECGRRLCPVLTGGDAALLAALMPELGTPEPLLTLRGIALCAEEMKNVNFSLKK